MAQRGLEAVSKELEGAQHLLEVSQGASKVDRGWIEGLEGESKVVRSSGLKGETGLEPRQASEGDSRVGLDSKVKGGLEKGKQTFQRLFEASYRGLERYSKGGDLLSKGRWVSSNSKGAPGWSQSRLEAKRRAGQYNSSPNDPTLASSQIRAAYPASSSDMPISTTKEAKGIPSRLYLMPRCLSKAGGGFDIEVEASRSRNEVPLGGSRGEGGFDRVSRGKDSFEGAFEGVLKQEERLEGGNGGSLGRRY
ncbi:hypothetical protein EDD15DRAFT_2196670 [Pisolithus albus]|nr:hypothetical protein EDD15DRAFT_2196670 [Pisolithus albus]